MTRWLRVWRRIALMLGAIVLVLGALFAYLVYTPAAAPPALSGTLQRASIAIDGLERDYLVYLPRDLPQGAPLLLVLHGSGMGGATLRAETGYAFDRLADTRAFAVVYPYAFDGYWDVCNRVGDVGGGRLDDVKFLTALSDKLVAEAHLDPARVFVAGSSRGGSMALRLALEAPARFRAVAAVSASFATEENSKCHAASATPSVLLLNGTDDPLVPFDGGNVSLWGLFYKNGRVRSAHDSAAYFAALDGLAAAPETQRSDLIGGVHVECTRWRGDGRVEVELVAIHGAGHGLTQPWRRRPRLLGPSPLEPNGAEIIWEFFARQQA